jgi:hypothetical protein
MSRCSSAIHSLGRRPVAAANSTNGRHRAAIRSARARICLPGIEWTLLYPGPLPVLHTLLGRVAVEHPPADSTLQGLAQRLGGLEPVPVGDRHPPRGDFGGREFADRRLAERRCGFAQQPAKLRDRLGLSVVLAEVHLDEISERRRLN